MTKEIISAEGEKQSLIQKQNLKRDALENNVNQLIAKKYVLEAIQREEEEWAEKRIKLEKMQREQFGELVKKYQKKNCSQISLACIATPGSRKQQHSRQKQEQLPGCHMSLLTCSGCKICARRSFPDNLCGVQSGQHLGLDLHA